MKRRFFLGTSVAAALGTAVAAAETSTIPGGTDFVERKANFDERAFAAIVDRPSDIRQVFEAIAFKPSLLNNVKNTLNGFQFGYGYAPDRIAVAVAGHGPSSAYAYTDYVWSKYRIGEFFDLKDSDGHPIVSNVYLAAKRPFDPSSDPSDPDGSYQDTSIETLQRRGVIMLTCHTAVEEQARGLVKRGFAPAGMSAKDVANDILLHLIPGALVNPAMVATLAILQARYRYTYLALTI